MMAMQCICAHEDLTPCVPYPPTLWVEYCGRYICIWQRHPFDADFGRTSSMFTVWRVLGCVGLHTELVIGHRSIPPINPVGNARAVRKTARQRPAPRRGHA